MHIEGSCHCRAVRFRAETRTPVPYQRCYCSICRKTAGGGGYAVNIMASAETLEVEGMERVRIYHAHLSESDDPAREKISPGKRHFCGDCGSALWIADPRWPEWIYPFASAIDTPLPAASERVHMMLDFVAAWVEVPDGPREAHFAEYPAESIEDWHRRRGLLSPD